MKEIMEIYGILNEDHRIVYINYWIFGYDYFEDWYINDDASIKALVEGNNELADLICSDFNYVILDEVEDYDKGIERTKELIKILLDKDIKVYDIKEWMEIKMKKELEWEEEKKREFGITD